MLIRIERQEAAQRPAVAAPAQLVEIVSPRTNAANYTALEHFFAPLADPLLGVLAALGTLPPGWRAVTQLVLRPAPANWARRHLRRTVEHALEPERAEAAGRSAGWGGAVLGLAFLATVIVAPRLWALYLAHGWLVVALLGVPVVVGLEWLYALWLRLSE